MKRLFALIFALVCCGQAHAQVDLLAIQVDRTLGNGNDVFTTTDSAKTQIVIATNGALPSNPVIGIGKRSELTAHGSIEDRFVTTEGWTSSPTVIEPTVVGNYFNGGRDVPDHPYGSSASAIAEQAMTSATAGTCDCIDIDGDAPTVERNKIVDFRGDAITVRNNTTEVSQMIRIPRVAGNMINHCWNGIVARCVDVQIEGNRIANVRTNGIHVPASGGSCQISDNHVFGAQVGCLLEGGPCELSNNRFSDAPTGLRINSGADGTTVETCKSEHCWNYSYYVTSGNTIINGCRIRVPNTSTQHAGISNYGVQNIVGIFLEATSTGSIVANTIVEVGAYTFSGDSGLTGSTGVLLDAHNVTIDKLKISGDATGLAVSNETGVRITPGRLGLYLHIDGKSGGFDESGDEVVLFDDADACSGIVFIEHNPSDNRITIPSGWTSALTIYTKAQGAGSWTQLTTGQAYP